jgi:taurine dioxygenase
MPSIEVRPLQHDLPFGARISGINWETVRDEAIRKQVNEVFEDRGMIVFDEVEPSGEMQVAISTVFGPLKDHPVKMVARVDQNAMPGVIEMKPNPRTSSVVEVDGQQRMGWQPYHFDHCYNDELNRAGVLRSVITPPEGGYTAFADGIQLYHAISPHLRQKIEGKNIVYTLDTLYIHQRFGLPKGFRELQAPANTTAVMEMAKALPRAIHPAVWTRPTGEKVLHVSAYMAVGVEGSENRDGDALLEAVSQEIRAKAHSYIHEWKPTDMLIWDNWRMLHAALGVDPKFSRCMHRTTIKGDYGLGYWENHVKGPTAPAEMM